MSPFCKLWWLVRYCVDIIKYIFLMSRYANVLYPLVYFTNGVFQVIVFFFLQINTQIHPHLSFQTMCEQMYAVFSVVSLQSFHHFCISMILQCQVLTSFHSFIYVGSGNCNITMPIVSHELDNSVSKKFLSNVHDKLYISLPSNPDMVYIRQGFGMNLIFHVD